MDTFYRVLRSSPIRRGPDRWVAGICAGLAARFGWDVTWVRIATLLVFLFPGVGIGTYLVLWLLLPKYDGSIALERLVPNKS